jgi:hypothetical protein
MVDPCTIPRTSSRSQLAPGEAPCSGILAGRECCRRGRRPQAGAAKELTGRHPGLRRSSSAPWEHGCLGEPQPPCAVPPDLSGPSSPPRIGNACPLSFRSLGPFEKRSAEQRITHEGGKCDGTGGNNQVTTGDFRGRREVFGLASPRDRYPRIRPVRTVVARPDCRSEMGPQRGMSLPDSLDGGAKGFAHG